MSDDIGLTGINWRDHLDEADDFRIQFPAHLLDPDDGAVTGPATLELAASAGGLAGIELAVDLPYRDLRLAVWFTPDIAYHYAAALGHAGWPDAEPIDTTLPAWSVDDPPAPQAVQITTDPDRYGVYLNLGPVVLGYHGASVAAMAVLAAFNYLVANDPRFANQSWWPHP